MPATDLEVRTSTRRASEGDAGTGVPGVGVYPHLPRLRVGLVFLTGQARQLAQGGLWRKLIPNNGNRMPAKDSRPPRDALLAVAIALAVSLTAAAQEALPVKQPQSLRELIDAAVNQIEVFGNAESQEPAKPLVALRWANNARGSEDGMTILYVHAGRPLAAACLYPWDKRLIHDFESLSRDKIVARKSGALVWQPQQPAVKFAAIPEAPDPAETPTQRLRQMKTLSDQFQSAMLGWKADSTDREELRLLPRPLYRYEPKEGPVLDGAVFAFVMGTDPESLLLIEAVKDDSGKAVWQFAFARRTSGQLEGRHQEKIVWHADRFPGSNDPVKPHFAVGQPIPPELLPAPAPASAR